MPPALPPVELGHSFGPRDARVSVHAYLDYVCPFSRKAYITLRNSVGPHYISSKKSFRWVFHHQVQPWHPQSTMTHEAGIAVAKLGGEDAFWSFSDVLFERQTDFFDVNVVTKTRPQIAAELAALAAAAVPGLSEEHVKEKLALAKIEGALNPGSNVCEELKWEVKHSRLLGIHVSPTTVINGLVVDTSSSWGLPEWQELLDPLLP